MKIKSTQNHGFTLAEILIVVTIIVILGLAFLVGINPMTQIFKGHDTRRKADPAKIQIALENYHADHDCYPPPSQICYNDTGGKTCNICGNESLSPDFNPYLPQLPCDPQHPSEQYLYQVDDTNCPTYYRIYIALSNTADPAIARVGCQNGCGPTDDKNYNYGVTSPNTGLEKNILDQYACLSSGCTYCCGGVDCETLCSSAWGDYCDRTGDGPTPDDVYIVNNKANCVANCPCP